MYTRMTQRRSLNACSKIWEIFYQSVVASAKYCGLVSWGAAVPVPEMPAGLTNSLTGLEKSLNRPWRCLSL